MPTTSGAGAREGAQKIIEESKKDRPWLIAGTIGAWIAAIIGVISLFCK